MKKWRSSQLQVYPSVDLVAHARAALTGAQYHLERVREQVLTWRRTVNSDKANASVLHLHLRAFFWELHATMETTWGALGCSKTKMTSQCAELKRAKDEEWWKEVEEWRNFSHRAFLFVQGAYHPDGTLSFLFLPPLTRSGHQHHVPDRMESYLAEMRSLQERVLPVR